jgi:hypothetical protein
MLAGSMGLVILFDGCAARYSGEYVKSFEDAREIVGAYQEEELTERSFLEDWPMLANESGNRYEWVWGILEASEQGRSRSSYWVGYFEPDDVRTVKPAPTRYVQTDSTGTVISQAPEVVIRHIWAKHSVWRLDFQDSVLVSVDMIDTP